MIRLSAAPLMLALIMMSACASQSEPPVIEYALSPPVLPVSLPENQLPLTLRVARIEASRIYQVPDLYYQESAYQRNPYAYNRWVDAPITLLQLVIQDRLAQQGLFKAVLSSTSTLAADRRLEITLHDFSQHFGADGSCEGVVRLRANLVDARKGRLLGSRQFMARVPAGSRTAAGGVVAINEAVSRVLQEMTDWLVTTVRVR